MKMKRFIDWIKDAFHLIKVRENEKIKKPSTRAFDFSGGGWGIRTPAATDVTLQD